MSHITLARTLYFVLFFVLMRFVFLIFLFFFRILCEFFFFFFYSTRCMNTELFPSLDACHSLTLFFFNGPREETKTDI